MASRFFALALAATFITAPPPAQASSDGVAAAGGIALGVGVLGSIIAGIVWGVKAHEEYCDPNSEHHTLYTKTEPYTCSHCNSYRVGRSYFTNCYPTTCYSNTNYCKNAAGALQPPLVRREAGYDAAMYTTIGFLSLLGIGGVTLCAGLASN